MKCYMIFYEYHNLQSAKTRMTPKIWYTSMNKKMKYGCGFNSEGEGKVAVFSAKRWGCRSSEALIESATPCHDAQVVGP